MHNLCISLLGHVDAGKTTLTESLLYISGAIRKQGRVDNKDAFLDTYAVEKQRGITVFSKCARLIAPNERQLILLDTPGHVDFSAEAERTAAVLDAAVLILGGMDMVTGHAIRLWKLLRQSHVPTFIFVNKSDLAGFDYDEIMDSIHRNLSDAAVDFGGCLRSPNQNISIQNENGRNIDAQRLAQRDEDAASCDETLMEIFLEKGMLSDEDLADAIHREAIFPCFCGSALNNVGTEELLEALQRYVSPRNTQLPGDIVGDGFTGRVVKISYDDKGNRETHLKVISGTLKVKSLLMGEKVNEVRLYNGAKYTNCDTVCSGDFCAILGPTMTKAFTDGFFAPVMSYSVHSSSCADPMKLLAIMRRIEDMQPEIALSYNSTTKDMQVMLMGVMQTEVLQHLVADLYHESIEFDDPRIAYRETIAQTTFGIGHYEPLRHFADVHLRMDPMPVGSGLSYATEISEDDLAGNWQRLILTHLKEKEHVGVLTGSPITDMQITLIDGKAHLKHTEGGDFREATYRAVRQGLMKAESHLLEPIYEYTLTVPTECVGRAITDLQLMKAEHDVTADAQGNSIITGKCPVSEMNGYEITMQSYTKGRGRLELAVAGYALCHNEEEVIAQFGYDPERDTQNPVDSVFCSHGAGHIVKWNEL